MNTERRKHRRLPIQLPLICRDPQGTNEHVLVRSKTVNVSTGGLYFETLAHDIKPGQPIEVELTIPPGDGHFPYQGRVTATGEVIRIYHLPDRTDGQGLTREPR